MDHAMVKNLRVMLLVVVLSITVCIVLAAQYSKIDQERVEANRSTANAFIDECAEEYKANKNSPLSDSLRTEVMFRAYNRFYRETHWLDRVERTVKTFFRERIQRRYERGPDFNDPIYQHSRKVFPQWRLQDTLSDVCPATIERFRSR